MKTYRLILTVLVVAAALTAVMPAAAAPPERPSQANCYTAFKDWQDEQGYTIDSPLPAHQFGCAASPSSSGISLHAATTGGTSMPSDAGRERYWEFKVSQADSASGF